MHLHCICFFIMRQERFAVSCCQIVLLPALRVNGQIFSDDINNEERTVTVGLAQFMDLEEVIVTRFDYSEEKLIRI